MSMLRRIGLFINVYSLVTHSLARRSSKMKDMSRNLEGDRRFSFKEEMFKRAEETRSLMMSRRGFKANNGAENGHVGRTSPTGIEHQSAFKIKVLK